MFPMDLKQGEDISWTRTASDDEVKDITANRTSMSGLYYDLLLVMERNMNFTSKIYIRRFVTKLRLLIRCSFMLANIWAESHMGMGVGGGMGVLPPLIALFQYAHLIGHGQGEKHEFHFKNYTRRLVTKQR